MVQIYELILGLGQDLGWVFNEKSVRVSSRLECVSMASSLKAVPMFATPSVLHEVSKIDSLGKVSREERST